MSGGLLYLLKNTVSGHAAAETIINATFYGPILIFFLIHSFTVEKCA